MATAEDRSFEEVLMLPKQVKYCPVCKFILEPLMQVDYVLVYNPTRTEGQRKRDIFEEELLRAGLKLDYVQSVR